MTAAHCSFGRQRFSDRRESLGRPAPGTTHAVGGVAAGAAGNPLPDGLSVLIETFGEYVCLTAAPVPSGRAVVELEPGLRCLRME